MSTSSRLRTWLRLASRIPSTIADARSEIAELGGMTSAALRGLQERQRFPFVAVLCTADALLSPPPTGVFGESPMRGVWDPPEVRHVRRVTLGDAGELTEPLRTFELQAQVPMNNVTVTVFCDLREVKVQLFHGVDLVTGQLGPCPMGYLQRPWEVGVKLRVQCERRF